MSTARQIIENRLGRDLGPIATMPPDLRRALSGLGKELTRREPPLTAGEAIAHGVSLEATARAISRTWVRRYGYREACELIDAMQDEARSAANG